MVQKEVVEEMQERLSSAEEALAAKQNHIDQMKQEIFSKEEKLQTISVFQAQVSRLTISPRRLNQSTVAPRVSDVSLVLICFIAGGGLLL